MKSYNEISKKYQVFISSTYEDLKSHRLKVRDTILEMMHFPVGMELFGAANEEQWEVIKQTIETSDYYVLIIGNRYGTIIADGEDADISYTEKEYNYAIEIGVPILSFIVDSSVPVDTAFIESDEKREKLEAFKQSVKNRGLVAFWKSEEDLAVKVSTALYKQMDRTKRPGWVRGMDAQSTLNTINDLNCKVRELEKENKKLKESADYVHRSPKLDVFIEYVEPIEKDNALKKVNETDDGLVIYRKSVRKSDISFPKMTLEDVPKYLKDYVSEAELEKYNSKLPTPEVVNSYNNQVYNYRNTKENGMIVKVVIVNNGNVKATDINVDIDFSKAFTVMEKSHAIHMNPPKEISAPISPIEEAEEKNFKDSVGNYDFTAGVVNAFPSLPNNFSLLGNSWKTSESIADSIDINIHRSLHIKEHGALVWQDALIHTYECYSKEFCIVPNEVGEYTITITAICEELFEPMTKEIKVRVVESET